MLGGQCTGFQSKGEQGHGVAGADWHSWQCKSRQRHGGRWPGVHGTPIPLPDGFRHLSRRTKMASVDSEPDDRTGNNTMRNACRVLSEAEKAIRDEGLKFHDLTAGMGNGREISLAKTKIEEAAASLRAVAVLVYLLTSS
jgi:hypothetical protein